MSFHAGPEEHVLPTDLPECDRGPKELDSFVAQVALRLARPRSMMELFNEVAQLVQTALKIDLVQIWCRDQAEGPMVLLARVASPALCTSASSWSLTPDHCDERDRGSQLDQVGWTNDSTRLEWSTDPFWSANLGLQSGLKRPLTWDGRVVGMFELFARRPLSPGEVAWIEAVEPLLSEAIDRHLVTASMRRSLDLLRSMRQAQGHYILSKDHRKVFDGMLNAALELTASEYGFLSRVLTNDAGQPYMKTFSITNITWDESSRRFYEQNFAEGLEFHNLDTLFGQVMVTKAPVISNHPARDPRAGGIPAGHPPLRSFLGLPIMMGDHMVGLLGLANRPGGYDEALVAFLQPFLQTCAGIIEAHRVEQLQRETEEELRRAKHAAEEANQAKSRFLANISHEIRTPIAALCGYSEMVLEPQMEEPERRQTLLAIRRNSRHLLELVDDILDFSKIEAGEMTIEHGPVSPRRILEDLLTTMGGRARSKGIAIHHRIVEPIPDTITTDPTRLRQILLNFLSNAIKFTDRDKRIDLVLQVEPAPASGALHSVASRLVFTVEDQGPGIAPENLSRLFQPFWQVDGSITRRYGGTGLGLSISQRLAGLLGGVIEVESEVGRGSRFRFALPLQSGVIPCVAPTVVSTGPTSSLVPSTTTTTSSSEEDTQSSHSEFQPRLWAARYPWSSRRVLVVEDSPDIRNLIRWVFKTLGLPADFAENGRVGIECALSQPYDLILMDLSMPELDGYSTLEELRRLGLTTLPVVALTAHAFAEDRERCLAAGFSAHLTKPIGFKPLVETLVRLLNLEELATPSAGSRSTATNSAASG